MSKRKNDRTIFTPEISTDLAETQDRLIYWKQILPEAPIQYTQGGATRTIDFDSKYHQDCIDSFRSKAVDQTCFQLADSKNNHGRDFDPERQRAEVLDMATFDALPEDVKTKVNGSRGLYAKMRFFDKASAQAVEKNPGLGVSARVRENFTRADGTFVKRAVIHVLGTIDPRVTGMSAWQSADLSYDPDSGYVLDLSNETYEGTPAMAKQGKKNQAEEIAIPTDAEIDAMTDDELAAFLDEGDENFIGDPDEIDGQYDDETDETETEEADENGRVLQSTGASLSNRQQTAIDLANAQARQANERANDALARQAAAEFRAYRSELIGAGVPPAEIDLAMPVLARANDMVIDLSNDDDSDGENLNVTDIVRGLLEARKGTIDMSVEQGHSGTLDLAAGDVDPDAELLAAWDDLVPSGR